METQTKELEAQVQKLLKQRHSLMTACVDAIDSLSGYVDVDDGDEGPRPNFAMRLTTALEDVLTEVSR